MALLLIFTIMGAIDPFTGGLLSGLGSAFGNMISGDHNAATQHKYAMRQMAQQQKYQLEQMQQQDKYNKGFQQMLWEGGTNAQVSGLRNAGLNPAGASSSIGAQTAGNSVSTGMPNANGANPGVDLAGSALAGFDAFSQYQMAKDKNDAEIALTKAMEKKTLAEAGDQEWKNTEDYRGLLTRGMSAQAAQSEEVAAWYKSETEMAPEKKQKLIAEATELFERAGLDAAQAAKCAVESAKFAKEIEAIAKNMEKADVEMAWMRAKIKTEKAMQKYYNSAAGLNDALATTENFMRGIRGIKETEEVYNTKVNTVVEQLEADYRAYLKEIYSKIPPEFAAKHEIVNAILQDAEEAANAAFHIALAGGAARLGGKALGGAAKSAVKVAGYGK